MGTSSQQPGSSCSAWTSTWLEQQVRNQTPEPGSQPITRLCSLALEESECHQRFSGGSVEKRWSEGSGGNSLRGPGCGGCLENIKISICAQLGL